MWKYNKIFPSSSVVLLGTGIYFFNKKQPSHDSPLNRSLRFYSVAIPAYLHYEISDRFGGQEPKDFNRLHDIYSPIMRDTVLRMRGFFLKAAQLMSVREDYLPRQYLEWTQKMQNEAPITFSAVEAKKIVCGDLNISSIEEIFSEWTDTPVGSASIGQVYRARLKNDGKIVAVKVQSPNAESQFKSDLAATKRFCKFALPHLVVSLEEIERQFLTEFDYSLEAKNMLEIKNNLNSPYWTERVVVPSPYLEYCTKHVLVMDFIEGRKLSDVFSEYLVNLSEELKTPVEELKKDMKSKILAQGLTNVQQRWWELFLWNKLWRRNTPDASVIDLFETAMKVHGYQIFLNGAFNGDPHPGNLILTPQGKLGLIDFGQVKRLSPERREQFARLIIALSDNNEKLVCEISKEIGCENLHNIPEVVFKLSAFWLDRDTPDITMGLDIHKFLEAMEKKDPQISVCQDLVMVARCSVMMRSLGLSLGMRVRTTDYWRPYAQQFLESDSNTQKNRKDHNSERK